MKLTTFLAAFASLGLRVTSSPAPTGLAANVVRTLLKRGFDLVWDPPDAYKSQRRYRRQWEETCSEALAGKGCVFGTIHQGKGRVGQADGKVINYVSVEAGPSMDLKDAKKMRVFDDGSVEDGWTEGDVKKILEAKRAKRGGKGPRPRKEQKAILFWKPEEAYQTMSRVKSYWEHRCDVALTRKGCSVGLLHKGMTKTIRNGEKTSYISVDGAPITDMEHPRKFRVYDDSSTEEFTEHGWPRADQRTMYMATMQSRRDQESVSKRLKAQGSTTSRAEGAGDGSKKRSKPQERTSNQVEGASERPKKRPKAKTNDRSSNQATTHAAYHHAGQF